MKNLTVWLNTNKISLNVEKTEPAIFKHLRKKQDTEIKIKLNRKRLYPSQSVKISWYSDWPKSELERSHQWYCSKIKYIELILSYLK